MNIYASEEEQVEALKKWWKENGRSAIAGVVIGLGGVLGWQAWTQHQEQTSEQASVVFAQLANLVDLGVAEEAKKEAQRLISEYQDTPYALFATFYLAKIHYQQGDLDGAQKQLEQTLLLSDDPSFQQVARLRLGRLLLEKGDLTGASAQVRQSVNDRFAAEFAELLGDIAKAKNDIEGARSAYQKALDLGDGNTELLQMKLDDLMEKGES